jgi:hypothetical protein
MTMGINLVIAVTDGDWFEMLRQQSNLSEVNFWAPSAANFRALHPGELLLFKLRAPRNAIVGGGIFAYANALPCSLAWEAFREANGARSAQEMRTRIARYRKTEPSDRSDFNIGCRILTQPFFFKEGDEKKSGAPEEIRTPSLLIRSQMLYPVELRARDAKFMVEGAGFEPANAYAGRFTVCCL